MKKQIHKSYKKIQMEEIKNKLYDTAISLFSNKGYMNTTVQEICTSCGIAKGTFYYYFHSKEDIIRMSFGNGIDEYLDTHIGKYIGETPDATIKDKISFYISLSLHYCKKVGKEVTTLAFIFNLKQQLSRQKIELLSMKRTACLNMLIDEGMQHDLWTDSYSNVEIYRSIETFIIGAMLAWCYSIEDYDINEENEKMIESFLNTLMK